jgi:hypothetical protein
VLGLPRDALRQAPDAPWDCPNDGREASASVLLTQYQSRIVDARTIRLFDHGSTTPEMARPWFEKNIINNRGIRPQVVDAYPRDMAGGRWTLNGDPIRFDTHGNLIDGQHRLLAIIAANVPVKSFVVRDLDDDVFLTLDSGIKRTMGDELTFGNEKNAIALAAAIQQLMRYEHGILDKGTALKATRHEQKDALERHGEIRESIHYGQMTKAMLRHSLGTVLHYLFSRKDKVLADQFFVKLAQGTNLKDDDPIYLLRERLMRENLKGSKTRLVPKEVLAITIKAWNAKRKDEKPRSLRWRGNGEGPEDFPAIV